MITKRTQVKINELIYALSDRASKAVTAGSEIPLNAIDSLSRLIEVAKGTALEDKPSVIGFTAPVPPEETDDE